MSSTTRTLVILAAVGFAVLWFANLQYRDLFQTDEGRYAEIPREMVASGDWVTPRLDGLLYFEKPVLQYWTTAVAYELFGQSNWTSRLWTALTGFLGVLMTMWAGWRLFDWRTAWCAALLLASSIYYVIMGHFNTLDMGVSFFMGMSVFAFLFAMRAADDAQGSASAAGDRKSGAARGNISARRGWMYLAWIAAALGMLSKGLEAVVLPGLVFIIYTLVTRDWKRWKQLHVYGGILLFVAIAGPWYVVVSLRNPSFAYHFFIFEHFYRFLTPEAHRPGSWWYFIPILLLGLLPWWPQFVRSIVSLFRRGDAPPAPGTFNYLLFLWLWCVVVFVFFSISSSKLASYILPIVPALALIVGQQMAKLRRGDLLISALLCMALVVATLWLAPLLQREGGDISLDMYKAFLPWLFGGCALLLVVAVAVFFVAYFRCVRVGTALLAVALLLATQIVTTGAQAFSPVYSGHSLARQISAYNKPGLPFYSVNDYQQSLPFYLQRTLTLVAYQGELYFGIQHAPGQWIPDLDTFIKRWGNDSQALAVMPTATYATLEKQGVPMQILGRDPERIAVKKP
ncbi:MAG: glycosyltransferase family 39 protein [Gammaproteobacteria bacterium]|nr:glycosyltransferase family 39 protein [Gammaproteobacteria bacterium]MBU6509981.1 glycosyltransferase family 39 protein [Gammaproteobacteria bacterium]MDE1984660.1 glycosyltransferase family 39 protein [Gammaproteobacteria bacterium]MDE2109003.1 glycosyltransferase family 39 protein [Gammaproteobacteria bacterium]MDE2460115.1 glycosyltransferase family 39 protein [Gammaproteobacteria bacterium]